MTTTERPHRNTTRSYYHRDYENLIRRSSPSPPSQRYLRKTIPNTNTTADSLPRKEQQDEHPQEEEYYNNHTIPFISAKNNNNVNHDTSLLLTEQNNNVQDNDQLVYPPPPPPPLDTPTKQHQALNSSHHQHGRKSPYRQDYSRSQHETIHQHQQQQQQHFLSTNTNISTNSNSSRIHPYILRGQGNPTTTQSDIGVTSHSNAVHKLDLSRRPRFHSNHTTNTTSNGDTSTNAMTSSSASSDVVGASSSNTLSRQLVKSASASLNKSSSTTSVRHMASFYSHPSSTSKHPIPSFYTSRQSFVPTTTSTTTNNTSFLIGNNGGGTTMSSIAGVDVVSGSKSGSQTYPPERNSCIQTTNIDPQHVEDGNKVPKMTSMTTSTSTAPIAKLPSQKNKLSWNKAHPSRPVEKMEHSSEQDVGEKCNPINISNSEGKSSTVSSNSVNTNINSKHRNSSPTLQRAHFWREQLSKQNRFRSNSITTSSNTNHNHMKQNALQVHSLSEPTTQQSSTPIVSPEVQRQQQHEGSEINAPNVWNLVMQHQKQQSQDAQLEDRNNNSINLSTITDAKDTSTIQHPSTGTPQGPRKAKSIASSYSPSFSEKLFSQFSPASTQSSIRKQSPLLPPNHSETKADTSNTSTTTTKGVATTKANFLDGNTTVRAVSPSPTSSHNDQTLNSSKSKAQFWRDHAKRSMSSTTKIHSHAMVISSQKTANTTEANTPEARVVEPDPTVKSVKDKVDSSLSTRTNPDESSSDHPAASTPKLSPTKKLSIQDRIRKFDSKAQKSLSSLNLSRSNQSSHSGAIMSKQPKSCNNNSISVPVKGLHYNNLVKESVQNSVASDVGPIQEQNTRMNYSIRESKDYNPEVNTSSLNLDPEVESPIKPKSQVPKLSITKSFTLNSMDSVQTPVKRSVPRSQKLFSMSPNASISNTNRSLSLNNSTFDKYKSTPSTLATVNTETTLDETQDISTVWETPLRNTSSGGSSGQVIVTSAESKIDDISIADNASILSVSEVKRRLWDDDEKLKCRRVLPVHNNNEYNQAANSEVTSRFTNRFVEAATSSQSFQDLMKSSDKNHDSAQVVNLEEDEDGDYMELTDKPSDRMPIPRSNPAMGGDSVAQLVAKINLINRDDPSKALAEIDSILQSETTSLVGSKGSRGMDASIERVSTQELGSPHSSKKDAVVISIEDSVVDDPDNQVGSFFDHDSTDSDDYDSDDSTVSSITNPTYQSNQRSVQSGHTSIEGKIGKRRNWYQVQEFVMKERSSLTAKSSSTPSSNFRQRLRSQAVKNARKTLPLQSHFTRLEDVDSFSQQNDEGEAGFTKRNESKKDTVVSPPLLHRQVSRLNTVTEDTMESSPVSNSPVKSRFDSGQLYNVQNLANECNLRPPSSPSMKKRLFHSESHSPMKVKSPCTKTKSESKFDTGDGWVSIPSNDFFDKSFTYNIHEEPTFTKFNNSIDEWKINTNADNLSFAI